MYLAYRSLETADVDACLDLVPDDYAENPDVRSSAPALWRRLLAAGTLSGMVLEDLTLPPGERLAAFGMSVFVTPAFMAEARRGETPGLAASVTRQSLAGRSPVLEPEAIRRANSGPGLNLLVLHYWQFSQTTDPERLQRIREKHVETFFYVHGGYRFAEMLVEHRDERLSQFALEGGFRIRSVYDSYYQNHPRPSGSCPTLLGIAHAETVAHPGLHAARLFHYAPPRFYFKPREQALLRRALLEETDEEIARALDISVAAIKKRWVGIYDRVSQIDPALFPDLSDSDQARRGQEKRRHLMRYLRLYPEELRPVERPDTRGISRP